MVRGQSTHMRARAELVARELSAGGLKAESAKTTLLETREAVLEGWKNLSDILERQGEIRLAATVRRFTETMPPPRTEKESIAHQIRTRIAAHRAQERALMR